jgi:hypothetical protein
VIFKNQQGEKMTEEMTEETANANLSVKNEKQEDINLLGSDFPIPLFPQPSYFIQTKAAPYNAQSRAKPVRPLPHHLRHHLHYA